RVRARDDALAKSGEPAASPGSGPGDRGLRRALHHALPARLDRELRGEPGECGRTSLARLSRTWGGRMATADVSAAADGGGSGAPDGEGSAAIDDSRSPAAASGSLDPGRRRAPE